ncbi:MAG: RdgB/HAM1 family non-canonical purine NTP pyrophosphatase [Candidatus Endonucleobacter bathymodioli]|uniref:dITP/XTP pyrophosphatase n=1 Tax=Candidatus Endonucleibacter bathymodioli TaxID=539814 RepID=A0AA90P1N4_9GAMM|nr:RdgB/HAM1 family non-canonical purine NTP pyrophosphatase [Candidatus Endonucleobacter bathymodioli]
MEGKLLRVVLASSNSGKRKEFQGMLANLNIEMLNQSDFNVSPIEETGLSFVENAILKARHAAKITGFPVIADDSGLEVDAIGGQPGIYSARYAGDQASDLENNKKLIEKMEGTAPERRTARFQCLLVFLRHERDATPIVCQGSWEGLILDEFRGGGGFGYDPLFFVPSENCTSAELSPGKKNQLSHRAKAMEKLVRRLRIFC